MKDTLIIGTFVAAVVGFWFFLQKAELPPLDLQHVNSQTSRGKSNERRDQNNSSKVATHGTSEGVAGRTSEAEGLPSIYSKEQESKSVETEKPAKKVARQARSKGALAKRDAKKEKMIHGVPLNQWIEWNKNNLRLGEVAGDQQSDMRFFVQCMEIRKGKPQSVGQRDCKKLISMSPQGFGGSEMH
jgi:hypothetical protein